MAASLSPSCVVCGEHRRPRALATSSVPGTTSLSYCVHRPACRRTAVAMQRFALDAWWKLFLRYGVWLIIGAAFLAWELLGVKALRRAAGMGERDHPSLSEIVWELERRFGLAGQAAVLAFMVALTSHFVLHTPLIPGVG